MGSGLLWSHIFKPKFLHINNSLTEALALKTLCKSSSLSTKAVFWLKSSNATVAKPTASRAFCSLSSNKARVETNFSPSNSSISVKDDSKATTGSTGGCSTLLLASPLAETAWVFRPCWLREFLATHWDGRCGCGCEAGYGPWEVEVWCSPVFSGFFQSCFFQSCEVFQS